jgi:hypothetical protein
LNEAPRVHIAARRRCGGVAARGASHVLAIGRPFDSDRVIVCVIF